MPTFVPRQVPRNWYFHDVGYSIELLRTYIKDVEARVDTQLEEFRAALDSRTGEDAEHGSSSGELLQEYGVLDRRVWDLRGVYEVNFPDMQRQGALVTLLAFLERELTSLCVLFQKERNLSVRVQDLRGGGIERSTAYLQKVISVPLDLHDPYWLEIKHVQRVRNLLVHNGGSMLDHNGRYHSAELRYVESRQDLRGVDEVHILHGYLLHVLDTVDRFCQMVDRCVWATYGADKPPYTHILETQNARGKS